MEKFSPLGAIYVYISIIMKHLLPLKPLGQSKSNFMEHHWKGGKKVYINGQGHMTKMAAMAINRKKLLKSSSPEPEGQ